MAPPRKFLKADEIEAFCEKHALDQFPRSGKFYIVTSDNLGELDIFDTTKALLGTHNRPGGSRPRADRHR